MTDAIDRPGAQQWVPQSASIDDLRTAVNGCRGCELWENATQAVFSAGSPTARIAFVGEQPGDEEDRRGIPFVGPAGRLLQKAVEEAGIDKGDVYITNAVKHFRFTQSGPPESRQRNRRIHATPERMHVEACRPWLQAELARVGPELTVCLGATATRSVLGPSVKVTRDRGNLLERETSLGVRRFLVTLHPSAVLRAPDRDEAYAGLVADLRTAAAALG